MTELLRQALKEAVERGQSLRSIERATNVKRPALTKFLRGEQSLRLDKADALAAYFGIRASMREDREE